MLVRPDAPGQAGTVGRAENVPPCRVTRPSRALELLDDRATYQVTSSM